LFGDAKPHKEAFRMNTSPRYLKHLLPAIGLLLLWPQTGRAQEKLPAGEGRDEVRRVCTACHAISTVLAQRKDAAGWTATVNTMVDRGAQGSDEDIDRILKYLIKNFSKDQGETPATPTPTTPPR
jgi:mono/diheme cytochrome c family protein